ncbi:MAG: hypothetical protein AAF757_02445 [Cyanobacteria bacterium P01_D01_bin.116]
MPSFEITKENLLNPIKSFIETTIEAGLMSFSYGGETFKIVKEEKEKPLTQGQRLAKRIRENIAKNGINYEADGDIEYKKCIKSMDYERWSK